MDDTFKHIFRLDKNVGYQTSSRMVALLDELCFVFSFAWLQEIFIFVCVCVCVWLKITVVDYKEALEKARTLSHATEAQVQEFEARHSTTTPREDSTSTSRKRASSKASGGKRSRGNSTVKSRSTSGATPKETVGSTGSSPRSVSNDGGIGSGGSGGASAEAVIPVDSGAVASEVPANDANGRDAGDAFLEAVAEAEATEAVAESAHMPDKSLDEINVDGKEKETDTQETDGAPITTAPTTLVHETSGAIYADDDYFDDDELEASQFCVTRLKNWIDSKTPQALKKYEIEANVYNAYFVSELIVEVCVCI